MRVVQHVHEGNLLDQLNALFPHSQKHVKSRKQTNVKDPTTGAYLELDIWIPDLLLSFEFQDPYHYVPIWYSQRSQSKIQSTDEIKKEITEQKGYTLVPVPYWWNGDKESLQATISFYRPELFHSVDHDPIPLNPLVSQSDVIPSVGELMLASFPSDPNFNEAIVAKQWWMGEKYDGIRFCWNYIQKCAFTRTGKTLQLLPGIVSQMPTNAVDGELWFGRGQYAYSAMLFSGSTDMVYWHFLRANVFDISARDYQKLPFERRYSCLLACVLHDNPFSNIAARKLCEGAQDLKSSNREVIEGSGEGVILRKVASFYVHGRSDSLFKIKSFHGDKEGIVVGLPSQKTKGVTLKLPNGITFTVETKDVEIEIEKIKVGDIVSFSYDYHSRRDIPVSPKIFKIRSDLSWLDIVSNSSSEQYTTRPVRFWTIKTMRNFFEDYAKRNNKDPLSPETWYNSYKSVKEIADSAIRKFKGGYFAMLQKVFPEIDFNYSAFSQPLWKDVSKRRKFFENYAKQNHFNPRNSEAWLSQSCKKLLSVKGARGITAYYGNNVHKTLLHLFPDIGLDKIRPNKEIVPEKEIKPRKEIDPKKETEINERRLFYLYAKEMNFDAKSAVSWHQQSRSELLDRMGINMVASRYGGIAKALLHLFPNIGLQKLKYQFSYWSQMENRKKFFIEFAKEKNFDVSVPHNWYQAMATLLSSEDISKVIMYHNNQLTAALADLLPHVPFDKLALRTAYAAAKRRMMLMSFAKQHSFDALNPEHWYQSDRQAIKATKGISKIVSHYDGSVSRALADLFSHTAFDPKKYDFPVWRHASDRRGFFVSYAEQNKFDPFCANHWYLQPLHTITSQEAREILSFHNSDVRQALADLFPELKINKSYFDPQVYWEQASNRRCILIDFARERGFDAYNPEDWYSQAISAVLSFKNATKLVQYHQNVPKAIVELFPEIEIDKRKLKMKFYSVGDKLSRKKFFETYAKRNHFDPSDPEQWYHRTEDIMANKGSKMVMYFYKNSVAKALLDLFPNIGLMKDRFY